MLSCDTLSPATISKRQSDFNVERRRRHYRQRQSRHRWHVDVDVEETKENPGPGQQLTFHTKM